MALLSLKALTVTLGQRKILDQISFDVCEGALTTIIGPNGSGKTTLMRAILGMIPYVGRIKFSSGCTLGYVPQKINVNTTLPLTVMDFLKSFGGKPFFTRDQVIEAMGLQNLLKLSFHHLSGGERQRVLMARALVGNPDLLVLDEATSGLDLSGEDQFAQFLNFWVHDLKKSAILISHDLHYVLDCSDQVICLNGHICCSGSPEQVRGHKKVKELFGEKISPYVHRHDHSHGTRLREMSFRELFYNAL